MAQTGLWMLASMLVIGVGQLQPRRRDSRLFGWMLLAALLLACLHYKQFSESSIWLVKVSILLTAAWIISERGEFKWLCQAVRAAAWFQIPVMFLQAVNTTLPWMGAPAGLYGTVIKRGACSILLGAAAIFSSGYRTWILYIASWATGSFSGMAPLLMKARKFKWWILAGLVLSLPAWWTRLSTRWMVWSELLHPKWNVLSGIGFRPFPFGFQDDTGDSVRAGHILLRDLHSTWIDFTVRFGLVGVGILILLFYWIWKNTRSRQQWEFLVLALVAGSLQSAESFPAMIALGLVWLIHLNEEESNVRSL